VLNLNKSRRGLLVDDATSSEAASGLKFIDEKKRSSFDEASEVRVQSPRPNNAAKLSSHPSGKCEHILNKPSSCLI
jgi:hypothetical protein